MDTLENGNPKLSHPIMALLINHHYKGSKWNVHVEWENGEITWEPLGIIAKSDPFTCAIYAKEYNLLDTPGWVQFKRLACRQKKLIRMANQIKLKSLHYLFRQLSISFAC